MSQSSDTKKIDWVIVKDFTSDIVLQEVNDVSYTLVVRVSRSEGFRPRFSIGTGRYVGKAALGERITHYLPVFTRAQNAKVNLTSVLESLSMLITQAEAFILRELQFRENVILDEKIAKEKKMLEKDKPKNVGGTHRKTESA